MNLKQALEQETSRRTEDIARSAVLTALRTGVPAGSTMKDIISELQEDERLLQAFEALTLSELRDLFGGGGSYGRPGPDRRRGITSGRILSYIVDHPGARRQEIAKALGLNLGAVSAQLATIRAQGKVRAEGKPKRYRYFAV